MLKDKRLIFVLICLIVFLVSFLIHWYPIYKKGEPPSLCSEHLTLSRNLALTGEYKNQNSLGTVLSSQMISKQGDDSVSYNKLTAVFYSYIYRAFGYNKDWNLYITLAIYSLVSVLLFCLTRKLFNLSIALIQAFIFILLPIISYVSVYPGFYEWGILAFSLGLFFYLPAISNSKYSSICLIVAGIFFTIGSLARSAFMISVLIIFVFEFLRQRSFKRILLLALPLLIGWSLYLVPDIINNRTTSFLSKSQERYNVYGHMFPDPYTFYFEKENFLKNFHDIDAEAAALFIKLGREVSFKDKALMYLSSFIYYPSEMLKIVTLGGPLVLILLFLGLKKLFNINQGLTKLFIFWIIIWYLSLSLLKTNNWDHLIEIIYPVSLLVSLGVYKAIEILKQQSSTIASFKIWVSLFIVFLIFHFVLANKWMYHEEYSTSNYHQVKEMAAAIEQFQIDPGDVIAVDLHPEMPTYLNYFTDKSYIHFNPTTLYDLYDQDKLKDVFNTYHIKYLVGFEPELTKKIQEQVNVVVIE